MMDDDRNFDKLDPSKLLPYKVTLDPYTVTSGQQEEEDVV